MKLLERPKSARNYGDVMIRILVASPDYTLPPSCMRKMAQEGWSVPEKSFNMVMSSLIDKGIISLDINLDFKLNWERYNEHHADEEE